MSELIIYSPADTGEVQVRLEGETVWLTQEQMGEVFGRERSVITKHLRNIFKEEELEEKSVCANFAHTAADGKTYQVIHYNLDVIISVGYRVNSRRGVQFRQWATRTLREHLTRGYIAQTASCSTAAFTFVRTFSAQRIPIRPSLVDNGANIHRTSRHEFTFQQNARPRQRFCRAGWL